MKILPFCEERILININKKNGQFRNKQHSRSALKISIIGSWHVQFVKVVGGMTDFHRQEWGSVLSPLNVINDSLKNTDWR